MLNLMPLMTEMKKAKENEDSEWASLATTDMLNQTFNLVPTYVKEFKGLMDANGDPIAIETVVEEHEPGQGVDGSVGCHRKAGSIQKCNSNLVGERHPSDRCQSSTVRFESGVVRTVPFVLLGQ